LLDDTGQTLQGIISIAVPKVRCRADRRTKFRSIAHRVEGLIERNARGQSGHRLGQGGGSTEVIVREIDARRGVRDGRHLAGDIVGGRDGAGGGAVAGVGRSTGAWHRAKRRCSAELQKLHRGNSPSYVFRE